MTPAGTDAAPVRLVLRGLRLEYATLPWECDRRGGAGRRGPRGAVGGAGGLRPGGADRDRRLGGGDLGAAGYRKTRRRAALRRIAIAFAVLALYLAVQSTWVIAAGFRARHSPAGIASTALTAAVMFALAYGKTRTGTALGSPVLTTEGRVTLIDGLLATAVLAGLILDAALGWWWADPAAGYVLVFYAAREAPGHPRRSALRCH